MRNQGRKRGLMPPKPVHPTAVRTHGLFGLPFVRQHMMADERWTPGSLTEEFKGMTDLLSKRIIFKKLEWNATRKNYVRDNRKLRHQCRDGRTKLQMTLYGDNTKKIRNYLINHKDMQRLYQKMPIHMVVDNINQRTFVMRKERDRLRFRLGQLKMFYEKTLMQRAVLENRIKYENEFVLEEEKQSRIFRKNIECSNVRLKAIKTINGTYKKMLQVLRHDGIFYEPILRSLSKDIEDQTTFVNHILYLGQPAISKFKELSEEYRQMEDKARKSMAAKMQLMATYRKEGAKQAAKGDKAADGLHDLKRYVRETQSMLSLKNELEVVENTIKMVKFATLCSQAKEIYPRIKSQVENNEKLNKIITNDTLGHTAVENKLERAEVLEGVLINNLTEEENGRLNRIALLREAIEDEDRFEERTIAHMKNRADAYVLLRYTLWNLNEILRHVDRPSKAELSDYPNSYLKLPLLKFEMLIMRACPPEVYEENIDKIMHAVKRKVRTVMKAYTPVNAETMKSHNDTYHTTFLDSMDIEDNTEGSEQVEETIDVLAETKTLQNVPNRKQIKALSAKIVEELSKKED